MNAKTARKLRKYVEHGISREQQDKAVKALKVLVKKGQVKFNKHK